MVSETKRRSDEEHRRYVELHDAAAAALYRGDFADMWAILGSGVGSWRVVLSGPAALFLLWTTTDDDLDDDDEVCRIDCVDPDALKAYFDRAFAMRDVAHVERALKLMALFGRHGHPLFPSCFLKVLREEVRNGDRWVSRDGRDLRVAELDFSALTIYLESKEPSGIGPSGAMEIWSLLVEGRGDDHAITWFLGYWDLCAPEAWAGVSHVMCRLMFPAIAGRLGQELRGKERTDADGTSLDSPWKSILAPEGIALWFAEEFLRREKPAAALRVLLLSQEHCPRDDVHGWMLEHFSLEALPPLLEAIAHQPRDGAVSLGSLAPAFRERIERALLSLPQDTRDAFRFVDHASR